MNPSEKTGQPPDLIFPHYPALDGFRAVAVLLVMLTHSGLPMAGNGNLGVDMFFALSGFLISSLLLHEFDSRGSISVKGFYLRRIFRIFPPLYILLLAILAFTLVFRQGWEQTIVYRELIASSLYVNNIAWSWGWDRDIFLGHTWSLACEEQFYLIWPWILLAALYYRKIKWLLWILAGMLTAIISLKISGKMPEWGYSLLQESLIGGCLAAFYLHSRKQPVRFPRYADMFLLTAILLIGLMPWPWFEKISEWGGKSAAGIVSALLILLLLANPGSTASRWLSVKPLTYIGKISYALYLWHVPVFRLYQYHCPVNPTLSFLLKFATTFLLAILSWKFLEKRSIAFGKTITRSRQGQTVS